MKILHLAAIFMIMLVITIPITLSYAFSSFSLSPVVASQSASSGASGAILQGQVSSRHESRNEIVQKKSEHTPLYAIKSLTTVGSDNITGIRRKTDQTTVIARLDADANGIQQNQVWLGTISQFSNCQGTPESDYQCTITYPSSPDTLESRDYTYDVHLYNQSYVNTTPIPSVSYSIDTKQARIIVDDRPPFITSFTASAAVVGTGDITFSYIVNDNSCTASSCAGYCSGVKELRIYKNTVNDSSLVQTVSANSTGPPSCIFSGSFAIPSSALGNGTSTVYAVAYDMFGQASPSKSADISVNTAAPAIVTDSFSLLDLSGNQITYLTPASQNVIPGVLIQDSDLDASSVKADFTALNNQGNKSAVCSQGANGYVCIWPSVAIPMSAFSGNLSQTNGTTATVTLTVYAQDTLGNAASANVSKTVSYDGTGPIVRAITTNNDPYLTSGSTITVSLEENGAGLNNANIYLDLTPLGLGVVKADSCNPGWTCTFSGISPLVSGKKYISLALNSMDDVGNLVTGDVIKLVNVDTTPPEVLAVNTTFIAGANPLVDGMPTAGASIEISATVEEEGTLSAVADFSSFITGASSLPGTCTNDNSSVKTCKWSTPAIDRSGPYTENAQIQFSDTLGNNDTILIPIKVIGISNETNPNYWVSTVTCSPSLVDREVTPYVDMKVYCLVQLASNNANLLDMQMGSCYDASTGAQQGLSAALSAASSAQPTAGIPYTTTSPTGTTIPTTSGLVSGTLMTPQPTRTTPATGGAIALPNTGAATDTSGVATTTAAAAAAASAGTGAVATSSYIQSASLVNNINSQNPIIEIVLARQQMNINSINLVCPFQIISRIGDVVVSNPETENAAVNIYFYNNPNGDFASGLQDKIDAAKQKTQGLWNVIGWIKKIFFYAEKICNILYTINRVLLVFKGFQGASTQAAIASLGTPAFPYVEATRMTGCATEQVLGTQHTYLFTFGDKFCQFINCQMTGGKDQKLDPNAAKKEADQPAEQKKGRWSGLTSGAGKTFSNLGQSMNDWHQWGYSTLGKMDVGGTIQKNTGRDPSTYMNAKDNLVVALMTGCIPGIINGIDKLRQIECMYGVCLQDGVKGNGLPISSCEDEKGYAYCKYIFGEIFALIPFTAFFDYFTGMVKNALSDPLSALSIPFAYICKPICVPQAPLPGGATQGAFMWAKNMDYCGWIQMLSMVGEIISQVQNVINFNSWKPQGDYCQMLSDSGGNSSA